jgi:hypothetical protein
MSAAATAAGYLYASGRLRGRGAREQDEQHHEQQLPEKKPARREIRVAVLPEREQPRDPAAPAPKKAPKIEYRTRKRWTAE